MCDRCQDTGVRPLTEDELDEDDLDGYDPEDTMMPTTCACECEIGQTRKREFWARWGPIIDEAVKSMN